MASELKQLYRQIIRLHRLLPIDLRIIGDRYAQAEFKNFVKTNSPSHWPSFHAEWCKYLEILSNQLPDDRSVSEPETLVLGAPLQGDFDNLLTAEQRDNLERLRREATK